MGVAAKVACVLAGRTVLGCDPVSGVGEKPGRGLTSCQGPQGGISYPERWAIFKIGNSRPISDLRRHCGKRHSLFEASPESGFDRGGPRPDGAGTRRQIHLCRNFLHRAGAT